MHDRGHVHYRERHVDTQSFTVLCPTQVTSTTSDTQRLDHTQTGLCPTLAEQLTKERSGVRLFTRRDRQGSGQQHRQWNKQVGEAGHLIAVRGT
ncbi:hypothetical protein D3C84_1010830 [compost metagenome]